MEQIIKLEKISQYNAIKGVETQHPLISVFDNANTKALPNHSRFHFGFYAIFLKEVHCGELKYGRNSYDYDDGTLVFIGPGQVIEVNNEENYHPTGWALLFHPDLVKGTALGKLMSQYSFFSYESHEALHLSLKEQQIIKDLLSKLEYEISQAIDKHSKRIITNNIELLLNYCVRFYDRQFITRESINNDALTRFEHLLNDYFQTEVTQELGLPSVGYFASRLNLSPNYFGDLIKKETSKSAQEHIHLKLIDVAKERIFDIEKSVSQIAFELGFKYPQHFNRMFKKSTGYTPNEYRMLN
ncbi:MULTISPECIES: helix-turn-helix domain-containing protein [unclassified Arcicella]|uniref:helix-turn-helix domain-containing protein n=1 Tax=unclassified Arcicella TaxID=2644986 RepID=UPI002860DBAF|nr:MULTISPECIES: helix-turn-helix domain-containing protein [unclassified Arcicella]MDR6562394.1 AraC-like DNA-binding protein [Arcicella sp. BE51]MDR6812288.1 AraC-like DNA-binding protein [Arcicella sp. BE140]MDR6823619.1 AraC-like DNA-binding protein [Arcicella sp. BE139]